MLVLVAKRIIIIIFFYYQHSSHDVSTRMSYDHYYYSYSCYVSSALSVEGVRGFHERRKTK